MLCKVVSYTSVHHDALAVHLAVLPLSFVRPALTILEKRHGALSMGFAVFHVAHVHVSVRVIDSRGRREEAAEEPTPAQCLDFLVERSSHAKQPNIVASFHVVNVALQATKVGGHRCLLLAPQKKNQNPKANGAGTTSRTVARNAGAPRGIVLVQDAAAGAWARRHHRPVRECRGRRGGAWVQRVPRGPVGVPAGTVDKERAVARPGGPYGIGPSGPSLAGEYLDEEQH